MQRGKCYAVINFAIMQSVRNGCGEECFHCNYKSSLGLYNFFINPHKSCLPSGDNLFQITINFAKIFTWKAAFPST